MSLYYNFIASLYAAHADRLVGLVKVFTEVVKREKVQM